jgi:serine/alanine adding enzyme
MTSFKIVDKLNEQKWSDFVKNHPNGNIFQTPQMMKVYQNTKNYKPIFLASVDESDEIMSLVLAYTISEFEGALRSFSTRAIIQGGPLFKPGKEGLSSLPGLMDAYDQIARKDAIYTQIRNMWDAENIKQMLVKKNYTFENHMNFIIDLNRPPDDIFNDIHKNRRKNIRKAQNKGIVIEELKDRTRLANFYSPLRYTYQEIKMPLADISLFESAMAHLLPHNMVKFYIAKCRGEIVGSRTVFTYKDCIFDWYAGATANSTPYYPNEILVWHILEWGSNNKFKTFDFGGAGKPDVEYGVRTFKERFGGKKVYYGRFMKVHQPMKKKISTTGFKIWNKVR